MRKKIIFCFAASSTCVNFFQDLISNLSKYSDTYLITGKDHAFDELVAFSEINSIDIFEVDIPRKITFRLFNSYQATVSAISLIKKAGKDTDELVIFSNTPIMSFLIAIYRFFHPRIQHIHICHGLFSYNQRLLKRLFFKFFEQITFLLSDHIIFVSNSLRKFAQDNYWLVKKKIHNIDSITGVEIPQHDKKRSPKFRVGFFGRVCPDKGFKDFYSLYKLLPESFSFLIAGPIENEQFKKLIDLSDERLNYIGIVKDRADFFSNIDVLFFPSRREGFGVSIIEASAYGVPTIAYDIVGISDSLHSQLNGFKINYRDVKTASLIIQSLSKNRNELEELKQNSTNFVKNNYLKQIVLDRNIQKFNELI